MVDVLKVGDKIPPFFLKDHKGYDVKDQDIIGSPVVIYFYPKDGTPGCTDEACSFRDKMDRFDTLQALVIGVSPDSVKSHDDFITKNKLGFSLLSDEKKDMALMYGAVDDQGKIIRTTFVINSKGVVVWIEKPVKVAGHVERVIKALEEHCKGEVIRFDDFEKDYEDFLRAHLKTGKSRKKVEAEIVKEFGIKEEDIGQRKKKKKYTQDD